MVQIAKALKVTVDGIKYFREENLFLPYRNGLPKSEQKQSNTQETVLHLYEQLTKRQQELIAVKQETTSLLLSMLSYRNLPKSNG